MTLTAVQLVYIAAGHPQRDDFKPIGEPCWWCGHNSDTGEAIQRKPRILYRVRGRDRPEVYFWGNLAEDHAQAALRHLQVLRLDKGDEIRVRGVDYQAGCGVVGVHHRRLFRYRLVTPYFPSQVVSAREPREAWAKKAWAAQALSASLRRLLDDLGGRERPNCELLAQVEGGGHRKLEWRRRDNHHQVGGFTAEFVTNLALPSGMGIGRHTREGYGELELLDETGRM